MSRIGSEADPASRAYIGAGSNIEPREHLRTAIAALERRFGALSMSSIYLSPPVGFEGEDFLNLVIAFDTDLPVEDLVRELGAVEAEAGRRRTGSRFSSRTLDLDLLMYGDRVVDEGGLQLPREDILEYAFVLGPLAELAPELRHPSAGATMQELWDRFDRAEQPIERLDDGLA